jgi:hypothetical protein
MDPTLYSKICDFYEKIIECDPEDGKAQKKSFLTIYYKDLPPLKY